MIEPRIPVSTYRLQFNFHFQFIDALSCVSYLNLLGITDIYSSPIFKSRKNSLHGYDVVDPTRLNPELGTLENFETLSQEIRKYSMGFILDIVPNHMAVSPENHFWMDLLENGLDSPYADFFDIDWGPCGDIEDQHQVVLPILGKPYNQALENQEIYLAVSDNKLFIRYSDFRFPLRLESYAQILGLPVFQSKLGENNPDYCQLQQILKDIASVTSFNGRKENYRPRQLIKNSINRLFSNSPPIREFLEAITALFNGKNGDPRSFDSLDELLHRQVYRLVFWKKGLEETNFRRFFDINTLIGIKVEIPKVFEVTHALALRMVKENKITGLRIDHIDGLYDPLNYLRDLQQHIADKQGKQSSDFYLVVEKVLSGDELLPDNWPVQGTTGYDFSREVNGIFVDPDGIDEINDAYVQLTGLRSSFSDVVYEKKKQVMNELFPAEMNSLACHASDLAHYDHTRDLSIDSLKKTLTEIIARLPVYRTYIRSFKISKIDKNNLTYAFNEARGRKPALEDCTVDFLKRVLFLKFTAGYSLEQKKAWLHFVMRWQQFTGSVMAKGLEDTALYSYNRLISMNVIGVDQQLSVIPVRKFHDFNLNRLKYLPHTINATSTHDTKRSEDVRARINVLSEIPREWELHLSRWRALNEAKKQIVNGHPVPESNMDNLLYQTMIGAWPLIAGEVSEFKKRFKLFMVKAVREAKTYTSWINPNPEYEIAMTSFLDSILDDSMRNEFLDDFIPFQKHIAFYGALNSLSQLLLKMTSPGLPDLYQGMELWNFSLIDPDNRRQVDFSQNKEYLDYILNQEKKNLPFLIEDIMEKWEDGKIKLYTTYKALNARRDNSELFRKGEYLPLEVKGSKERNVVAFARHHDNRWAIVIVPRFCVGLTHPGKLSLDTPVWDDDFVLIPEDAPEEWDNIFTGKITRSMRSERKILLADIFNIFPVGLLITRDNIRL